MKPLPRKVQLALKLCTDIVPKLPSKGDSFLTMLIKGLSILDSTRNTFGGTKQGAMETLIAIHDLQTTENEQFVSLFFKSNLRHQFDVQRTPITDYRELIEARDEKRGLYFFFIEVAYGDNEAETTFYHTKGVDFADLLKDTWDSYGGRIHVTISVGHYGSGTRTEYTTFDDPKNPLYGDTRERLDALLARHRRYQVDGIPRIYMFYGPPGAGKSTFAEAFADKAGTRLLTLDATSLQFAHLKDIVFLLQGLQPDFLLIDDVDKASIDKAVPTLLGILIAMKRQFPKIGTILTANAVTKLDPGFFRPGRIDTWVEFKKPDVRERRTLITGYMTEFHEVIDSKTVDRLVEKTDGLTHDYVREVALMLKYDTIEDVLHTIDTMQKIVKEGADAQATPPDGSPSAAKSNGHLAQVKPS